MVKIFVIITFHKFYTLVFETKIITIFCHIPIRYVIYATVVIHHNAIQTVYFLTNLKIWIKINSFNRPVN